MDAPDRNGTEGTRGRDNPPSENRQEWRVLVVDDNPTITALIADALQPQGWIVETFTDPVKAMKRFSEENFDVVLTDLAMTDVSGMDVLAEVRRRSPGTAVILISGFGTIELAVEAMKCGAADFVAKPFSVREIREKVAAAIERRRNSALSDRMPEGESKTRKLRDVEKAAIAEVLARCGWNIAQAARELGISRSTLYGKMDRYGIHPPPGAGEEKPDDQ